MANEKDNIAARLHGIKDLRVECVPIPNPEHGEVQLRILSAGICGSDIRFWRNLSMAGLPLAPPVTLGHEACGIVVKVGSGVENLKVGDRVSTEPGAPCLSCERCKTGRYNLCQKLLVHIPKYCPGLSRYATASADFCYKLPDSISDEEGALVEPLAVAVHACRRASMSVGDTVLICGAGPIGMLCLLVAKARGASKVIITDTFENKLETALKLGASYTLNVTDKSPEEAAKAIEEIVGYQPNVTLECSGTVSAVSTAIVATGLGGVVTLVGMGAMEMNVPLGLAAIKEVDIRGTLRYGPRSFPEAISLLDNGQVDVKPIISHRFTLDRAVEAFNLTETGDHLKIMVRCAMD